MGLVSPGCRSFWVAMARVAIVMWLPCCLEGVENTGGYYAMLELLVYYTAIPTSVPNAHSYPPILYGVNLIRRATEVCLSSSERNGL